MISVGKCKELYNDNSLPSIFDLAQSVAPENKDKIVKYLKSGKKGAVAAGTAYDLIGNKPISGELCCYTDGKFVWRSDIIYYFENYNISLEPEFIKHIVISWKMAEEVS